MNLRDKIFRVKKLLVDLETYLKSTRNAQPNLGDNLMETIANLELNMNSDFSRNSDYLFLRISDLSKLMVRDYKLNWRVETANPIALNSTDHIHPRGVKQDETRKPAFVKQLVSHFDRKISYLDLGCAGGGLVYDFIINDCEAVGIEGSDYSLNRGRAYWHEIPWALHTADLTAPLRIYLDDQPAGFDVIGAWEFFEHIEEDNISAVLENIKLHLKDEQSLFLATIAMVEDSEDDNHWHKTLHGPNWWGQVFSNAGFEIVDYPFDSDFNPRGSGNPLGTWGNDYDIKVNPSIGFCIAAKLKKL
jgi:2-polyprenyl-3-methyl-5-hydroxy-6-metoxy-1,4-benzoquinol methylase